MIDTSCYGAQTKCIGSTCYPVPDEEIAAQIARGELAPCPGQPTAPSGGIQPWMKWLAIGVAVLGAVGAVVMISRVHRRGALTGPPNLTTLKRLAPGPSWDEVRPSTYGAIMGRAEAEALKNRLVAHGFNPTLAPMGPTAAQLWVKAA